MPLAPPATGGASAVALASATRPTREVLATAVQAVQATLAQLATVRMGRFSAQLNAAGVSPDVISTALGDEAEREREFAKRSAARLRAALALAMKVEDPSARTAAVEAAVRREQRYAEQRSEAVLSRALGTLERETLRVSSPQGAYWELGPAEQHCPFCPIVAGHFLPWEVLILPELWIPIHYGCKCRLRSYGDALAAGLLTPGVVLTPEDARTLVAPVLEFVRGERAREDEALEELDLRLKLAETGRADLELLAVLPLRTDPEPEPAKG